ncbi:hypothetical protein K402DRAFT_422705 [Aulographum hederae CBS 113979]|uniref:Uncharacterized protein n=1 Tax=Aulographum hederae CBS 113979 TaxID=1176131 RepID=A0A6G1GV26_9PEZI|nr:hypothetical protein K402DRAFT_422705 [Aulographum hederae CBS 113979]
MPHLQGRDAAPESADAQENVNSELEKRDPVLEMLGKLPIPLGPGLAANVLPDLTTLITTLNIPFALIPVLQQALSSGILSGLPLIGGVQLLGPALALPALLASKDPAFAGIGGLGSISAMQGALGGLGSGDLAFVNSLGLPIPNLGGGDPLEAVKGLLELILGLQGNVKNLPASSALVILMQLQIPFKLPLGI